MLREEIIKGLESVKKECGKHLDESFAWICEPIDRAIAELEQKPVLDKIRAEIEQTEINGHIRDVECFRAGINVALDVIDKYKAGE